MLSLADRTPPVYLAVAAILAVSVALRADLRRRRLTLVRSTGWHLLTVLDLASTSLAVAIAAAHLVTLIRIAISEAVVPLRSPLMFGAFPSAATHLFPSRIFWKPPVRRLSFCGARACAKFSFRGQAALSLPRRSSSAAHLSSLPQCCFETSEEW